MNDQEKIEKLAQPMKEKLGEKTATNLARCAVECSLNFDILCEWASSFPAPLLLENVAQGFVDIIQWENNEPRFRLTAEGIAAAEAILKRTPEGAEVVKEVHKKKASEDTILGADILGN